MGPRLPTVLVKNCRTSGKQIQSIEMVNLSLSFLTLLFAGQILSQQRCERKAALKICQGTGRPTKSAAAGAGAMLSMLNAGSNCSAGRGKSAKAKAART